MITEFEAKMADRMCEKFGDDFDTYFLVSARPTDKGYCPLDFDDGHFFITMGW